MSMGTSPSQDPETRARGRAEWRALMTFRSAGAIILIAVITVAGIVGLATGHDRSGITALMIIGVGAVITIAGWARRRRRGGG